MADAEHSIPQLSPGAQSAHDEAVLAGRPGYVDPDTGFFVFTAATLAARGHCCGSGCRHCPYDPVEQRRAGRPGSDPPDTG
jgi:hypothetical protein